MKEEFANAHYTDMQVARALERVKAMDHETMCRLWRYGAETKEQAIYFRSDLPVAMAFKNRLFNVFGGFTPEISKRLAFNENQQKRYCNGHSGGFINTCINLKEMNTSELAQKYATEKYSAAFPQAIKDGAEDFEAGTLQWEERAKAAEEIILGLVKLKTRKDTIGKDLIYESMKPVLWHLAEEHLKKYGIE